MREDEPLEHTPVFRNLDYQWSWYGLTFSDLPFVMVPGAVLFNVGMMFDVNPLWSLVATAAAAAALVVLKWRRPEGYVQQLLHLAFTPRRLSHKERDTQLRQFPLQRVTQRTSQRVTQCTSQTGARTNTQTETTR